jgi:hypothetical protein
MVPAERSVTGDTPRPSRVSEAEIVRATAARLEAEGYRVRADPDGHDYFDLVARRGAEVGLVEAKVGDARAVLTQALKRRGWGDWNAVVLGSPRAAARLAERTRGTRAEPVGVWSLKDGAWTVHRAARPWVAPGEPDPFAELRARFRRILDALDSGELPSDARWDGVLREVRRSSGGRGFGEWRLDETTAGER